MSEQAEKISILETLLKGFNDGRRKSFFCLAVNLLEVQDLRLVMEKFINTTEPDQSIKEKAATVYIQLELNVVTENTRALSMYEKAGFVEYGRNPKGFWSRDLSKREYRPLWYLRRH